MNHQLNHQFHFLLFQTFHFEAKSPRSFHLSQDPRDWAKSELQVRRMRWMQEAMQEAKVPSVLVAPGWQMDDQG